MRKKYIFGHFLYYIIVSSLILLSIFLTFFNLLYPYEDLRNILSKYFYHIPLYFNEVYYFYMVKKIMITGILLLTTSILFLICKNKLYPFISKILRRFWEQIKNIIAGFSIAIKNENKFHLSIILVIIFIGILIRMRFLFQPMRFDEAFSFLHFASKPFFIGLSYYEAPNNHLFYTFWVRICYLIFGNAPWILRLPALIGGILIIPFSYFTGRKLFNKHVGIIFMSLISASFLMIFYSTNSRGYTLYALFFLILLLLAKKITDTSDNLGYWILFILFSALGAYTIPTMVIPFMGIILWISVTSLQNLRGYILKKELTKTVLASMSTGVLTFLLYLPVFIVSGANKIFNNHFLKANYWSLHNTFGYFVEHLTKYWLKDIPSIIIFLLILGIIILPWVFQNISRYKIYILPAILLNSAIYLFINPYLGPIRVWLFIYLLFFLFASAGTYYLFNLLLLNKSRFRTLFFTFLGLFFSLYLSMVINKTKSPIYYNATGTFRDAKTITEKLKKIITSKDMIVNGNFSTDILLYYFKKLNITVKPFYNTQAKRIFIMVSTSNKENLMSVIKLNGYHEKDLEGKTIKLLYSLPYSNVYEIMLKK